MHKQRVVKPKVKKQKSAVNAFQSDFTIVKESLKVSAQRYGANFKAILKRKHRSCVHDSSIRNADKLGLMILRHSSDKLSSKNKN